MYKQNVHTRTLLLSAMPFLMDINSVSKKVCKMGVPLELALYEQQKGVRLDEYRYLLIGGVKPYQLEVDKRVKANYQLELQSQVQIFNTRFILRYELVTQCRPLPVPKLSFSLLHHRGIVYVLGGSSKGMALSCCHKYEIASNCWYELPPLSMARSDAGCILMASRIWMLGGFNQGRLQSIECYDLKSDSWTTLASLLKHPVDALNTLPSSGHTFIIFNGQLDNALPNTTL